MIHPGTIPDADLAAMAAEAGRLAPSAPFALGPGEVVTDRDRFLRGIEEGLRARGSVQQAALDRLGRLRELSTGEIARDPLTLFQPDPS